MTNSGDSRTQRTYQRVVLPNGLRLLTAYVPHVRSVTLDFFFGVGSRYDPPGVGGLAHFLEHMLYKGSQAYPTAQRISETIEGVGGVEDAATDKELTIYTAKVANRHFELALHLLSDIVRRPLLDAAEMEKEKRVIVEELGMYHDSPQDWVHVLADEVLWPDMPLGREVAGTRESVMGITREALASFHATHYLPSNLVLSVVGNVPHEQIVATVTELLGDWQAGPAPQWSPCPPPNRDAHVAVERRKTEQTNICLLMPGLRHDDPRYYAMIVLNGVLGDGMSSRLFQEVRERQGLAYDVGSGAGYYHDTGVFSVSAGVDPKRTSAALEAILRELARMRDELVTPEELTRSREYAKGRMTLRLEDTGSIASWLGGQEMLLNEVLELDEVLAKLDAVTAEDVQRLARDLFVEEWLRLAIIGPHKDTAEFERLLKL